MAYLDNSGLAYFWSKLKALFATKQDILVSGENIKTVNGMSVLGAGDVTIVARDGVGFQSVSSQQDGTMVITLSNGDTITVDLNHEHQQYPKYHLCASEAEYEAIDDPDDDTLYLIPETS